MRSIYPARIANIPINIRNTNEPENPGTMITSEPAKLEEGQIIAGIAGSKDFTVITMYKALLSSERGFIRKMSGVLEDFDIPIEHIPSGVDTLSVVISNKQLGGKLEDILDEFERQLKPDHMEVSDDIALIATVGAGMSLRTGVSAKLFTALAEKKVNIRMIDQGSSEMNIIVGVENKDFEKAIRAIYGSLWFPNGNGEVKVLKELILICYLLCIILCVSGLTIAMLVNRKNKKGSVKTWLFS